MSFEISHIPKRSAKPRNNGLTLVLDKGFSIRETEDFLESCADHTDIVKLGWGTACVTPRLQDKLAIYKNAGIPVYFGGTLFEAYVLRNELDNYLRVLDKYGLEFVEVSNGTIWLSEEKKINI